MSWIEKLSETYRNCADNVEEIGDRLWPMSHMVKNTHVEIVLNDKGYFRRARVLSRDEYPTLIFTTESSAGRTANSAPHPLADELGYCAADYPKAKKGRFSAYQLQLSKWCESEFGKPKAKCVLSYIQKGTVWKDLNDVGIFPVYEEDGKGKKTKKEDGKVFVRWCVEIPDDPCSETWKDRSLIDSWIAFDSTQHQSTGFCMVTGEQSRLAQNHPRFVRSTRDGGKLISSNDFDGYTFKGKFTDTKAKADKDPAYQNQACSVSYEVTQQAHNALRWLINRQGYRNGDQVIVTWSVGGQAVPDPFQSTLALFLDDESISQENTSDRKINVGDVGQSFAIRLKKALAGYRAKLDPNDDIVVMGLDSATPGRMAIIFYREMKGDDFLNRIQTWHEQCAWPQNFGKDKHFIGAPAPKDIAEAAHGRRLDDKLRKATVERLLPCIIDGQTIPRDLILSTARRASNRVGMDHWEWEKNLGIACSLFKGYYKERSYQMVLEQERTSRDYLYGRLLAIADNIENYALTNSEKHRDTMAGRLMQRFSDRPFSTWRNIELALGSYKSRLRASEKTAGFLWKREKLLDEVMCSFQGDDFTNDRALSGEFLLGFHCQRKSLFGNNNKDDESKGEDK